MLTLVDAQSEHLQQRSAALVASDPTLELRRDELHLGWQAFAFRGLNRPSRAVSVLLVDLTSEKECPVSPSDCTRETGNPVVLLAGQKAWTMDG